MLTSDLSRFLVQPHKQYSGVRLQQGRVFTDADHNEQAFLQENELRLATLDLLGPRASTDNGFILGTLPNPTEPVVPFSPDQTLQTRSVLLNGETVTAHDIWLGAGSLYVGGRRFELLAPEAFVYQRDFLQMKRGDVPSTDYVGTGPNETDVSFAHLYLLHTWEQEVSAVEDPEILEPALGDVDTSTRIRRMRRVEAFTELPGSLTSIDGAYARFMAKERENNADIQRATGERLSRGRLQLTFVEERATLGRCDECNPMPARRLLGAQNATLRILLTSPERYVWAYDNSAPLYRVLLRGRSTLANADKTTWSLRVEMLSPPIDETAWPMPGRVVELLPIGSIIEGPLPDEITSPHYKKIAERIGCFLRVSTGYTPQSRGFELEATDDGGEIAAQLEQLRGFVTTFGSEHPEAERLNYGEAGSDAIVLYCRLWHDASTQSSPTIPIEAGAHGAPLGDTGIVPVFHRLGRRGDFWIAALRPEQPRPIVPFDLSEKDGGVPPHGPKDYFVPLALVTGNGATLGFNADARQGIGRSVDTGCVTFTVGDGVNSQGDFRSIQEAIEALPAEGGHILVRRGTYRERLHLEIDNVVLEACGEHVVIETPPPESPPLPEDPDRIPHRDRRVRRDPDRRLPSPRRGRASHLGPWQCHFGSRARGAHLPGGAPQGLGLRAGHPEALGAAPRRARRHRERGPLRARARAEQPSRAAHLRHSRDSDGPYGDQRGELGRVPHGAPRVHRRGSRRARRRLRDHRPWPRGPRRLGVQRRHLASIVCHGEPSPRRAKQNHPIPLGDRAPFRHDVPLALELDHDGRDPERSRDHLRPRHGAHDREEPLRGAGAMLRVTEPLTALPR
ncbi:MAG: DUF6519 domain-containing protein [Polyangiaceae bacterium]